MNFPDFFMTLKNNVAYLNTVLYRKLHNTHQQASVCSFWPIPSQELCCMRHDKPALQQALSLSVLTYDKENILGSTVQCVHRHIRCKETRESNSRGSLQNPQSLGAFCGCVNTTQTSMTPDVVIAQLFTPKKICVKTVAQCTRSHLALTHAPLLDHSTQTLLFCSLFRCS